MFTKVRLTIASFPRSGWPCTLDRSWQGLHRHAMMTMIAYAFLQHRRLEQAGRKKRSNGPPPQPWLAAVRQAIVDLICETAPNIDPTESNSINRL
jgi:hypothetical protein